MPRHILKLTDPSDGQAYYLVWSTVVDAPITGGMSREALREHWREQEGVAGLREMDRAMDRVEATGVSSPRYRDPSDLLKGNRAGEDESELTLAEVIEEYCRRRAEKGEG